MPIDPSRLLLLALLREHGTISQVADRTGRTPSAVSQQLTRLEQEAGSALVERSTHGCSLTPLGERLAGHADELAAALHRADQDAREHGESHRSRLRLGAFPTAGLALLPDVLAALRHRHPAAELSVVDLGPVNGMRLVAERELDLALVAGYGETLTPTSGTRLIPLLHDPLHVVLPVEHPLSERPERGGLRDFADDPWACAPASLPNRQQLDRLATAEGIHPQVPFESESYAVVEAVVSAGVAIAFIPRLAISGRAGTTHRRMTSPEAGRWIHAVVRTDNRDSPLVEQGLRLLHQVCAERQDGSTGPGN